jgi:hypothetical protein
MPTTAVPNLVVGPGYLFWAPLATAVPSHAVAGSKFTDTWPVAWISLGATHDGSEFDYSLKAEPVEVAEFFDPIQYATTGREGTWSMILADYTANNLKRVLNGGAVSAVSGTGATTLTKFTPPSVGSEVRCMLGWESLDSTVRRIAYQCFQAGGTKVSHKRAPDKAGLSAEFKLESPSSGAPFEEWFAGSARVGS